ncbi:MAG: low molecular weight protein arginine phosphatase [Promethearchaeota archaeon]|nr:MAG: low molecular weight protein arginine phosphatase [Candidatus Lokiarchaeota archaeon]
MDNKFPFSSILIVCSVNTARSRMAEGFLRDFFLKHSLDVKVKSGGISSNARDGMIISMDARLAMEELGINLSENALSSDLKKHPELIEEADLILTLTNKHKEEINEFFNIDSKEILTIKEFAGERGDIEDPSMKELVGFRIARDEIIDCLTKGLKKYSF